MRSCERPRKKSTSETLPSSVSKRYFLSIGTHGSSCRRRASSSLRRVSSFSSLSSPSRAASHSSRVPVMCFVIALLSFVLLHRRRQPAHWDENGRYVDSRSNGKHVLADRCAGPWRTPSFSGGPPH